MRLAREATGERPVQRGPGEWSSSPEVFAGGMADEIELSPRGWVRDQTERILSQGTTDGVEVYDGTLASLKRFKDDVREVREGFECGIGVENFNALKVGDLIEAYRIEEVARSLTPA